MLTGFKTLLFSSAVALLGVATTFNWTSLVNATDAGYILTGIGALSAVLRFFTSTPVASGSAK